MEVSEMTSKAIITRRGVARSDAVAFTESTEAVDMGLKVEQPLPQGTLVSGNEKQLAAVEAQGYRVKLLPDTNILEVGAYQIDTEAAAPKVPAKLEVPKALKETWSHHLVQLIAPPNEDWIRAIEDRGIDVVEPISAYGLFVVGSPEQVKKLTNLPFVEWVGTFKPAYRIAPNLQGLKGKLQYINIGVYPATAVNDVRKAIETAGGSIVSQEEQSSVYSNSYGVLLVEMNADMLSVISNLPTIRWIEHQPPDRLEDERSCQIIAENLDAAAAPNAAPLVGYQAAVPGALGLNGAGVTIGIVDSGVDTHDNATMHPDLAGRMAFFVDASGGAATVDTVGHGTHVAGIAVGNAVSGDVDPQGFLLGQGIAPGAQFGSVNAIDTGGPGMSDDDMTQNIVNNGGAVMNNSWGGGPGGGYTSRSSTYDRLVRDPNTATAGLGYLVIVFSAGNSGPDPGTITTPKEAKNPIIVGNSLNFRPGEGDLDDIRGLRRTSSRGPAVDGRILPTIVAPGTTIISARSSVAADPTDPGAYTDTGGTIHHDHTAMNGTSMAAPHVAGLCALLIEWWRNRTGGRNPSPALLKAMLINGAIDIAGGDTRRLDAAGNPVLIANIPNSDQGWGRVSLQNMVQQAPHSDRGPKIFSDQRHAFTANGQEHTIRVAPVDPARPLRITLVWTDAAGAAGANPALVNDLDLEVTEMTSGNVFLGNVFANGFSTVGGAFDNRNNTECVYIENPTGTYEVRIIAANLAASARHDIATPWQDFALVIDNAEVPSYEPVSVVPVIDRSSSMVAYGYVDITRTSSKQFVDLMGIDDQLGVVSFGSTSTVEFPTGAAPTLQTITGSPTRDAAKGEIDGIVFDGCTFMGAGINEARDLLNPAVGSRGMVLLSDGYDNKGCDSTNPALPSALDAAGGLPANMPIYSCAMGPASDQGLLEQIAEISGGRYYFMPTIDDLFEIYNYIRGQVTGDAIVVNESAMASSSRVAAFVDSLASEATFTVAWADIKRRFVAGDPKKANEVSIRLRDPRGRLLHPSDSYVRRIVGSGYVVFKLQDPMPGRWYVEVSTVNETHLRYTVGGFVRSPLRLAVSLRPARVLATLPFNIGAQVFDGKLPIFGFKGDTQVVRPNLSIPGLLAKYKNQLKDINPGKPAGADTLPLDIAKLIVLRNRLLQQQKPDLFAHSTSNVSLRNATIGDLQRLRFGHLATPSVLPVGPEGLMRAIVTAGTPAGPVLTAAPSGLLVGQFRDTRQQGSYNVAVTVNGTSPISKTRFVRKDLVSVLVR
jgi:hypothetical protein